MILSVPLLLLCCCWWRRYCVWCGGCAAHSSEWSRQRELHSAAVRGGQLEGLASWADTNVERTESDDVFSNNKSHSCGSYFLYLAQERMSD